MINILENTIFMKLVSVIIPYFKKKKYIGLTISSVLKQTYKNFEVIIVYEYV